MVARRSHNSKVGSSILSCRISFTDSCCSPVSLAFVFMFEMMLYPLAFVKTVWPSGLRRWLQAPVRKGVGSNPTAVILDWYSFGDFRLTSQLAGSRLPRLYSNARKPCSPRICVDLMVPQATLGGVSIASAGHSVSALNLRSCRQPLPQAMFQSLVWDTNAQAKTKANHTYTMYLL